MKLFGEYPYLTDGTIILRIITEADAGALAELTCKTSVYSTLPAFLYELKYDDKREVIARLNMTMKDAIMSLITLNSGRQR